MNGRELREALRSGRRVYGTAILSTSPRWVGVVRGSGLDFVFIDTEHIPIDRHQLSWMCQAFGAVGVARAFAYGGAHGQRLWAPEESVDVARWSQTGDDPQSHTPVHEFVVKLSQLRDGLFTQAGRSIAKGRHAYMVAFFQRFGAEVRGLQ